MVIKKKKISELPLADTLVGLYTIGVNALNKSVKVGLEFLKTAADAATSAATSANNAASSANTAAGRVDTAITNAQNATTAANNAAGNATTKAGEADTAAKNANTKADAADKAAGAANTAAGNANSKASLADNKATAANGAAALANQKAQEANVTIIRLEELEKSIVGQYKMIPTGINLQYPELVTLGNTVPGRIKYELLPTNTRRNVLFLGDNNALSVMPNGEFAPKKPGISTIHVIPTENTEICKTIQITVVEPGLRKVGSVLRRMGNGNLRLT